MRASRLRLNVGGDAGGVVVGGVEDARVLHQVDADDQVGAAAEHAAGVAQERAGLVRLEIADGRSGKETGMRHSGDRRRQRERLREVGLDRQHLEARDDRGAAPRLPA